MSFRLSSCLAALGLAVLAASASAQPAANAQAIAAAARGANIVLLGEVHDNGDQHALRLAALRELIDQGARPAIAFEQFDHERQADIDRARRERPGDVEHLVKAAGGKPSWRWEYYRPLVQLALDHDLPVVAANLSRGDAIKVATQGWGAVFNAQDQAALGLDSLPSGLVAAHAKAIEDGHCGVMKQAELERLAPAQIARDIVLARSIRPYADRGVVLLAGNGHVRKDIGVPLWLSPAERSRAVSLGLIESEEELAADELARRFDHAWMTPTATRTDPCIEMRARHSQRSAAQPPQ
ncbi:MAG: ChaN family lipoprotein [Burkholderiaceae bacterium]